MSESEEPTNKPSPAAPESSPQPPTEVSGAKQPTEPVLPNDPPGEVPGTEESVEKEVEGTSDFSNMDRLEIQARARKRKNQGLPYAFNSWSLPGCQVRIKPTQHGAISRFQGVEEMDIKGRMGIRENVDLPPLGTIELNRRIILRSLIEWVSGSCDINASRQATKLKNSGVRFRFPRGHAMDDVVIRLRPLSHPYLQIVRWDAEQRLIRALGDPLPPQCQPEIDRAMILHSVMELEEGGEDFKIEDPTDRWQVRNFFERRYFPPVDLSGDPPSDDDPDAVEEYWNVKFDPLDYGIMGAITEAQRQILQTEPPEILALGRHFTVGAVWAVDEDHPNQYEAGEDVSWAGSNPRDLRARFADMFWPPVDLKAKLPKDPKKREEYLEDAFQFFSNDLLNEAMGAQTLLQRADPRDIVKKENAFILGFTGGTDYRG